LQQCSCLSEAACAGQAGCFPHAGVQSVIHCPNFLCSETDGA
jgi:hypothetical protein